MKAPQDIILKPVITEQSTDLLPEGKYTFKVAKTANKTEIKNAVEAGYWQIYRYNPELVKEGKNPFTLDSKEPDGTLQEFMMGENRFASLTRTFPERAEVLFKEAEDFVNRRYAKYKRLAED